jgi:6,7-dimethyl-8-ribityllumazine synthase
MNQIAARPTETSRIAFIQSCWHKDLVDRGHDAFLARLDDHGIARELVERFEVPGAFEIPLHAKMLARSGRYCAVVACALVVDGGIYRHEFVAQAVINGLMQVQLETEVPVFSVVLTPQHFHEHEQHHRFFHEHMLVKGAEAANACVATLASLACVQEIAPGHLREPLHTVAARS